MVRSFLVATFVFFTFLTFENNLQALSLPAFNVEAQFPARTNPQSQLWYAEGRWWGFFPDKEGNSLWERTTNGWRRVKELDEELQKLKDIPDVISLDQSVKAIFKDNNNLKILTLVYDPISGGYGNPNVENVNINKPIASYVITQDTQKKNWVAVLSEGKILVSQETSPGNWSHTYILNDFQEGKAIFLNGIVPIRDQIGVLWSTDKGVFLRTHVKEKSSEEWENIEVVPCQGTEMGCGCLGLVADPKGTVYVGTHKIVDTGKNYEKERLKAFAYATRSPEGQWETKPYCSLPKKEDDIKRNPLLMLVSAPNYLFITQTLSKQMSPQYLGVSPLIPEPARKGVPFLGDTIAYEIASSKQMFDQNLPMILLSSDEKGNVYEQTLPNLITPSYETDFAIDVGRPKDHVDDVAIWVHPTDPGKSLVIGSNKLRHAFDKKEGREETGGLNIYSLQGKNLKFYEIGSQNNVDLRYGFDLGDRLIDLIASTNQMDDTISLYAIDQENNELVNVAARPIKTGIEVYGFCLAYDAGRDKYYAFANSRQGDLEQYELFATKDHKVDAKLVRKTKFATQVEGCVADDEYGHFYIGEEKCGIWKMRLDPNSIDRHLIDNVGGKYIPQPDLEGLTIYYARDGKGYLIASSQGSSEYVIYKRGRNNDYLKTFKIVSDGKIDGTELTDGIDVCSSNLGPDFPNGLFIAHDSIAVKTGNSNFKFVSWKNIAETGHRKLKIEDDWNPRSLLPKGRQLYVSYKVKD